MATGDIVLGANQYGKAENRVVRINRNSDRHEIADLNVTSQLHGDFVACHTSGDNSHVLSTDAQKNTIYAFAHEYGIAAPEQFLLTLGEHFVTNFPWVSGGRWAAELYAWERILASGRPHDHSFVRSGDATRTALVHKQGPSTWVLGGFKDATVLKSTGSEFSGFPRDPYTTLAETDDRILATSITTWWRYDCADPAAITDWNDRYDAIKAVLFETFATLHSLALQQTIFAMGRAVLEQFPEVAEIRLSCPNKHHFAVDLEPFGRTNQNEVFFAADRPYGLIEAAVQREGMPEVPALWAAVPGFC